MPDASQYSVRDYLRSVKYEAMKLFRVYDGTGRVQYQYDTPVNTENGGICMRTEYVYANTSFNVVQMKETLDSWDSAWDI